MLITKELSIQIGKKNICRDLNLTLNAGDVIGVLGQNGIGKSTFLQTLARLHTPSQGNIFLHHQDISSYPTRKLARHIGIAFQNSSLLFPQSVFEVCASGLYSQQTPLSFCNHMTKEKVREALHLMQLSEIMFQNVQTLSGGEKQRLALATILLQAPDIYLLDEPLNHLDIKHQMIVMRKLAKLAENGAGIVVVLHDLNKVPEICNRVLMLFGNGEVEIGSREEMLTVKKLSQVFGYPMEYRQRFSFEALEYSESFS